VAVEDALAVNSIRFESSAKALAVLEGQDALAAALVVLEVS